MQLKKSLYGHPDSGTFWEKHCDKQLTNIGYKPIEDWSSVYWHEKLRLLFAVYVDDFKLSGPKDNLRVGWDMIRNTIQMEDPKPANLYLGCIHERTEGVDIGNGRTATVMEYNMEN